DAGCSVAPWVERDAVSIRSPVECVATDGRFVTTTTATQAAMAAAVKAPVYAGRQGDDRRGAAILRSASRSERAKPWDDGASARAESPSSEHPRCKRQYWL